MLHGDLVAAFFFNPLGMIALLGCVLYLLYAVVVVTVKLPRLRLKPLCSRSKLVTRLSIAFLIASNWIYLIVHERVITVLH